MTGAAGRETALRDLAVVALRFWEKVDVRGPDECWPWIGGAVPSRGGGEYGVLWFEGGQIRAHHMAMALAGQPRPVGLEVDHLCENKRCVNARHLEWVTAAVNAQRRSGMPQGRVANPRSKVQWCRRGHLLDAENLRIAPDGFRKCRACAREAQRRARARARAKKNGGVSQEKEGES